MRYSFIIPAYNTERYISGCLDSILNQTISDFEVIVIDDGSTDRTGIIIDHYKEQYPGILKVIHQNNKRQGEARNAGIKKSQGEYIILVDSDDYVAHDMLEQVDKYLNEYNDDLLLFSHFVLNESGKMETKQICDTEYEQIDNKQYIIGQHMACNKVYRASLFKNTDLTFPSKIYYEDLSLSPCFAIHAHSVGMIRAPLYYYVQHSNSTMHSKDITRMLDIIPAFDYVYKYFKQHGAFDKYKDELEWLAIQHVLYYSALRILYTKYDFNALEQLTSYLEEKFPGFRSNKYIKASNYDINKLYLKLLLQKKYIELDKKYFVIKRVKKKIKKVVKECFCPFIWKEH